MEFDDSWSSGEKIGGQTRWGGKPKKYLGRGKGGNVYRRHEAILGINDGTKNSCSIRQSREKKGEGVFKERNAGTIKRSGKAQ